MKKENRKKPILYLIIPCFNEEEVIDFSISKFTQKIDIIITEKKISPKSKLIFVDDGSKDSTWNKLKKSIKKHKKIIGIKLTNNSGHQNALLAGLEYAKNKCDIAISIDADLQQDINKIDEFIDKYKLGNDIVYGIRNNRKNDKILNKICVSIYTRFMKLFKTNYIENHADYRLISNKVICELSNYQEINLFLRGLFPIMGYKHDFVYFDVFKREYGKSGYNFSKRFNLALDGIISYSNKPFTYIRIFGILLFSLSIITLIIGIIKSISLLIIISCMINCTSLLIIILSIIGIYIDKILLEVKHRPRYLIETIEENE